MHPVSISDLIYSFQKYKTLKGAFSFELLKNEYIF